MGKTAAGAFLEGVTVLVVVLMVCAVIFYSCGVNETDDPDLPNYTFTIECAQAEMSDPPPWPYMWTIVWTINGVEHSRYDNEPATWWFQVEEGDDVTVQWLTTFLGVEYQMRDGVLLGEGDEWNWKVTKDHSYEIGWSWAPV